MRNDGRTQMIVVYVWLSKGAGSSVKMRKWEEGGWWTEWDDESLTYDKLLQRTCEIIQEQAYRNAGIFVQLSMGIEDEIDSFAKEDIFCSELRTLLLSMIPRLRVASNGKLIIYHSVE